MLRNGRRRTLPLQTLLPTPKHQMARGAVDSGKSVLERAASNSCGDDLEASSIGGKPENPKDVSDNGLGERKFYPPEGVTEKKCCA